ncbi:leukotriene A-4 hydrolase-like [Ischnura elegans]|uniref:leukotriene A-4 hydrolase-like n=1 Tax=Ischnura elegans TaxID=197161 RepID=UPI001ED86D51|nr:leukotriene A-4 hydrolase-like [Ischnura elegans]
MTSFQRVQQWMTFARTWHLFDAKWQNPFESALVVRQRLCGLHKPIYHPMNDCGDHVVVINCREIALPGDEWRRRVYFHHTGYPGGASWTPAWELHEKKPTMVMCKAVYYSMRGNLKRRYNMCRLHLFADEAPEDIMSKVTSQIRPIRPVPQRLDHYPEDYVTTFPKLLDWPKDYVFPTLKEKPTAKDTKKIMVQKQGLSPGDPNSFSRPEDAVVCGLELRMDIDFENKILTGAVTYDVLRKRTDVKSVILDSKTITIKAVKDGKNGTPLEYSLSKPLAVFGSKLEIVLPLSEDLRHSIEVEFETSPEATGLQWLNPEQTCGRKHPIVLSHCEAIHCRSIIPCQDTPSVKAPFTAKVTAPHELVVLMGAHSDGEPTAVGDGKRMLFSYKQPVPIPAYLLAFASGKFVQRQLGPRSFVWSEEEIIEAAAYEFAETEVMLETAEKICGPYEWGVYGLLVLPPSFPYGGMENPCLTFVTPTLLAGDRSLADVVAHEISHSWTGNLVTNCSFEHFWLNEGFTVFVERKICGRMRGEPHRHFSAIGGIKELAETIHVRGETNPLTQLVLDLRGVDPDDSFSNVPYEKGHTFLFYLEDLLGGAEVFDPFLQSYIAKYKFKSISTDDFVSYLKSYFAGKKPQEDLLEKVAWTAWLNTPGMPPVIPKYDTSLADACSKLRLQWQSWDPQVACPFTKDADLKPLSSNQIIEFLAQLLAETESPLSLEKVQKMQDVYNFNSYTNSEIKFRWLRLCIKAHWEEQIERALEFATSQGRMKFVRPIFRDLGKWDKSRERAIATFKKHRSAMMYVTAHTVASDLGLKDE